MKNKYIKKIYEVRHDYLTHMDRCKQLPEPSARWIIGYEVYDNLLSDPEVATMWLNHRASTFFGVPYKKVGYIGLNEVFYLNDNDAVIFKVEF